MVLWCLESDSQQLWVASPMSTLCSLPVGTEEQVSLTLMTCIGIHCSVALDKSVGKDKMVNPITLFEVFFCCFQVR